ncbi:MAG: hypothetical protein LBT84_00560 [Spirochaetia bacterium]|jgi:hypothetical protein|nr:hypothetical protein [Spirochaetia bacterium]
MEKILNDALMPMVNEGLLSLERINSLIYLRDFIDRVSTKEYAERRAVRELEKRYSVMPDIITWGDYFQTETASSLCYVSDDAFNHAVSAIRFDIMSCNEIFPGKGKEFLDWIDEQYYIAIDEETTDREESVQLKIMKDYYVQLGITDNFTLAERAWYSSYEEAAAM